MSSTNQAQGLVPVWHPSGIIRAVTEVDAVASGYGTAIYTGTPVKYTTDGTLVVVGTGADVCIGVFQGCQFSSAGKRFVLPYWPASQTYDAGSGLFTYTRDKEIVYEAQADGSVALSARWEGINLVDASQGSTYTGFSTQRLNHTTTGSTAATFQVVGLAPYDDNAWGDTLTKLWVKIASYQGQIA